MELKEEFNKKMEDLQAHVEYYSIHFLNDLKDSIAKDCKYSKELAMPYCTTIIGNVIGNLCTMLDMSNEEISEMILRIVRLMKEIMDQLRAKESDCVH